MHWKTLKEVHRQHEQGMRVKGLEIYFKPGFDWEEYLEGLDEVISAYQETFSGISDDPAELAYRNEAAYLEDRGAASWRLADAQSMKNGTQATDL